jgi:hypothetical protein
VIPRFPFGITKDPAVLTYYAVRLQAKVRLLFSPFGDNGMVTLQAYSAAKPFGSRIGKDLNPERTTDDQERMMQAPALLGRTFDNGSLINDVLGINFQSPRHPNVLVADGDTTSREEGFATNAHLGYLRGAVAYLQRLDYGPRLAGAYAPWEIGYYNPPADYQIDIIGKFEDNPVYNGKFFTLSAPLYPVNGDTGTNLHFIIDRVAEYLEGDEVDKATLREKFGAFLWGDDTHEGVMDDRHLTAMTDYMNTTKETQFHFIPDPMLSDLPDLQAYARAVGPKWTVAGMPEAYKRQLTSWNNQKTAKDQDLGIEENSELGLDMGRSGYSVRFVAFSSLKNGGDATNDADLAGKQWSNPFDRMDLPSNAARIFDDLSKLQH